MQGWSAQNAPRLYTYGTDSAGKKIAVDPANAANVKPVQFIGLYVQDSSGKVMYTLRICIAIAKPTSGL
jgi:hypothetical protein